MVLELNTIKYKPISIQSQHIVAIIKDSDEHGNDVCRIYDIAGNRFSVINKYEEISSDVSTSYTIVLTHEPDNFSALKNKDVDLVLAGHSLNGQIRLPFYGGLLKRNGCKEYIDGHYQVDNKELYVTNGFGTIKYNFRLFNKPSFNIYRLKNSTTK